MNNKRRMLIISTIIVLLLVVIVGVAYAFFTYENSEKSEIVTGQIYMNYEETSSISLTGVFPESKAQALARQDENGVFEFTITGRNTSKNPIYYEIDLIEGDVVTGAVQSTKILPEHVRIYLERDDEVLVDGETYADWNNRRIYVDTVPANQASNINHKYTLRMWIDENVTVSDTDPNADYTTEEWNNAYASLKVRVVGDFEEKELGESASCFGYNLIADSSSISYNHLIQFNLDISEENVNTCKSYLLNDYFDGSDKSDSQDGYQSFCEGTGSVFNLILKEFIANAYMIDTEIQSLGVVESYEFETRYYELNTSEESIYSCKEYMLNTFYKGEDVSDVGDGYQSYCEGTGTVQGYSIINDIEDNYISVDYLIENNILLQLKEVPKTIEITGYDETCGTDVVIPEYIKGLRVTNIADAIDGVGVFAGKNITSVEFPSTLVYIGSYAFNDNNLSEFFIPSSVGGINGYAFYDNPLSNVEIAGSPHLGVYSFGKGNKTGDSFVLFKYGGNCTQLGSYKWVFSVRPSTIITSDNDACYYTNLEAN